VVLVAEEFRGGTVLRGADGALYFIREELLEACRMEGDGAARAQQILDERKGASETERLVQPVAFIGGDLMGKDAPAYSAYRAQPTADFYQNIRASTTMCPWFC
jgi:hypothetical protein